MVTMVIKITIQHAMVGMVIKTTCDVTMVIKTTIQHLMVDMVIKFTCDDCHGYQYNDTPCDGYHGLS